MVPINPREEEIEGQKCAKSLSELVDPREVSVSIVTPPGEGNVIAIAVLTSRYYYRILEDPSYVG